MVDPHPVDLQFRRERHVRIRPHLPVADSGVEDEVASAPPADCMARPRSDDAEAERGHKRRPRDADSEQRPGAWQRETAVQGGQVGKDGPRPRFEGMAA